MKEFVTAASFLEEEPQPPADVSCHEVSLLDCQQLLAGLEDFTTTLAGTGACLLLKQSSPLKAKVWSRI